MSSNNQISVTIPNAVAQKAIDLLQEVKGMLSPYLQGLTPEQRHDLFKMGDKTVAMVSKVKSYLDTNPEFIPAYMDVAEFAKDESLVVLLTPVANLLSQLSSDADDTIMLADSEALLSAMLYYGTVNEAAEKGVVTAKPIYEDLQARFARKGKPKQPGV